MFTGAFTALATPFKNGRVDEETYREFIEWQIEQGINGLVPCGTTGESATMSHDEHERVIKICIEQSKKRVPVIAGAGSNNTAEAARLLKFAKAAGADAGLLITPYYNKPSQEGIFQHFKAIAAECPLPMFVYNVPGRTGMNVSASTMIRLYKDIPSVIGAKEASADLCQVTDILEQCDHDFILLSGDDFTVLPTLAVGGKGVISVSSNLAPHKMADMCRAWFAGDTAKARKLNFELFPLNHACFYESNPIPVKTMLSMIGKMGPDLRLPLTPPAKANKDKMLDVLLQCGLM
ncbi:MAG: 4-hydroxy-tetrahydrodipicolinate synthase [Deltaproteobacteria bacterium]|jgi:4-hydroxy-tetrahydrodipicolinate synthase|nr:4-hydroxy-tetrahydrodipicolinate synthase [Deltaproteobacteria bacterium]